MTFYSVKYLYIKVIPKITKRWVIDKSALRPGNSGPHETISIRNEKIKKIIYLTRKINEKN
jgi:hypothetical protein